MNKELIIIEEYENKAVELFENNEVEKVVQKIIKEAGSLVFDVDSESSRKDLKRHVAKIKKSSKLLDNIGKEKVAELKLLPKVYDKNRKAMRDSLEQFAIETEAPLIEWEAAESKRVNDISARINEIDPFQGGIVTIALGDYSLDELKAMAAKVSLFEVDESLQEQQGRAAIVKEGVQLKLSGLIANQMKAEQEAAELERLRQEAAAREQQEREERIAKEATEAAEREAAEKAKQEAARVETEKQAAKAAQEAAESRAIEAEETAKADAAKAVVDEQNRVQAAKDAETAAAEKREANKKHNAKINNAAAQALKDSCNSVDSGERSLTLGQAKLAIAAIAKKQIPNVTISY